MNIYMISFKPGDLMDDFGLTGDFEHFKYMLIKLQKYTNLSYIPLPQISATSIYLCSWYLTSAGLLSRNSKRKLAKDREFLYFELKTDVNYYGSTEEAPGGAVRCFSPRCHAMPKWVHVP